MLFPEAPVFIYFLFPIKAKYFVSIFIAIELFYGVTGAQGGVAHFAHLGGALVGFIYLMTYRKSIPAFDRISDFFKRAKENVRRSVKPRKVYSNRKVVTDVYFEDLKKANKPENSSVDQDRLDEILDKISASGYDSLTDDEKKILFNASKKLN